MAIIEKFVKSQRETFRIQPTRVECHYAVFEFDAGRKLIQLDTFGSAVRKKPGKQSQTLQLDELQAKRLWLLLGKEFGFGS